jgi:hypothetical protein
MCTRWTRAVSAEYLGILVGLCACLCGTAAGQESPSPFPGPRGEKLDLACREDFWQRQPRTFLEKFVRVPRDEVVGFALYTHAAGILKITAQLFPLKPGEPREVRLEFFEQGQWREIARAPVIYPGWSSHFRLTPWDSSRKVRYRVRHGENASFEGVIRPDPVDKDEIVVASLSCNSNADRGDRREIVEKLLRQDPDLLFFAGDQSYDHTEHTAAWLLWGWQFREVIRDRPTVTIPDDHDIGQGNLWGEGGVVADSPAGDSGGYYYPPEYINMVHRCQTAHLPDPVDPQPIGQGISVYFTRLRVGGIDFAIIADRQFKSGPKGKVPQLGPRPDHVTEPNFDPRSVDLPGLQLLGSRQMSFLEQWSEDWQGAVMKAVLSQTAFCGAAHLHGSKDNRLVADLDCNGWPQTQRNQVLRILRRAAACHLCGDQHLAVVVQHGIEAFRDGPFGFTNPAILNSYYGRWWWPAGERPGENPIPGSPLPWTGDYWDGLGNRITMFAYANPEVSSGAELRKFQRDSSVNLGDGYGLVRFRKSDRTITFECWPRYADLSRGDAAQFPGWPIKIHMLDNDGRRPVGHLPELVFGNIVDPVVQVIREADGEILYTRRIQGTRFSPPVFSEGTFTIRAGRDRPTHTVATNVSPAKGGESPIHVSL